MIETKFTSTLTLDGAAYLINSMTINYSINAAFPTTTLTVGHSDHTLIAGDVATYDHYPIITMAVETENVSYSYQGMITSVGGSETMENLSNNITVMPASFHSTFMVGSYDGTNFPAYLDDVLLLANDIIAYFNASVFSTITGLSTPLVLSPVTAPIEHRKLLVAPRFIGMTLLEMLEQIFGAYGYSVMFTWDNQIIVGSLNNPIPSPMIITKDMIGENSFQDDVSLNIANIQLGW